MRARVTLGFLLIFSCILGAAAQEPLTEADGVVSLIGSDLSAFREPLGKWEIVGEVGLKADDPKRLESKPGTGVAVNGETGHTVTLMTKKEHGDVEAHVEFMMAKESNSGVYFQGRYEVQILDSWGVEKPGYGDCGGIYQRWKDKKGYDGHAPLINACLAPGEWQTLDVTYKAPRFDATGKKIANAVFVKVLLNGKVIHENVECSGPTRGSITEEDVPLGPIQLQGDHGPVAYRNITLKAIKLD